MVIRLAHAKPGFYRLSSSSFKPYPGIFFVTGKRVKTVYSDSDVELYTLGTYGEKTALTPSFKAEPVTNREGFDTIFGESL
jgi:hypothetical protein